MTTHHDFPDTPPLGWEDPADQPPTPSIEDVRRLRDRTVMVEDRETLDRLAAAAGLELDPLEALVPVAGPTRHPERTAFGRQICAACFGTVGPRLSGETRDYVTELYPARADDYADTSRRFHYCDPPCDARRRQAAGELVRTLKAGAPDPARERRAVEVFLEVVGYRPGDRAELRIPGWPGRAVAIVRRGPVSETDTRMVYFFETDGGATEWAPVHWFHPLEDELLVAAYEELDALEPKGVRS